VTGANYGVKPTLCSPYTIPTCDHHLEHPKITPCGNEVNTPTCSQSCVDGETWSSAKHFGKSVYTLDMSQIYNELMTNGPVESSFSVYSDFLTYTGGVYQQTSQDYLGGHAIKIMGWGVENGTPYWLVANSWNPDWGLDGYFKILRGQDECGIEDGFVAGLPA
jgi:cathepsin B